MKCISVVGKIFKKLFSAKLETRSQKTVLKIHCTKYSVLLVESVSSTFFSSRKVIARVLGAYQ